MERHAYILSGQVQGVGFRPFVYRTARGLGLTGLVGNTSQGVRVEVQGSSEALEAFARILRDDLPPLARITSWQRKELPPVQEKDFRIIASAKPVAGQDRHSVLVSPDVATCPDCLADIEDPANRRYGYAFTNCTNCGPRYTITHSIPYDRATTAMSCFSLCPRCQAEYDNPGDRRFHAQPNACPVCGPRLWLVKPAERGACTGSETTPPPVSSDDTIQRAAEALVKGAILAVKGLGGFLLACDAANTLAVSELRRRKRRPHKAFAVMVPDLSTARRVAVLSRHEEELLSGCERPVVVVRRRGLPDIIAPDLDSVGLMLPYTPLHHLLLKAFALLTDASPALVMTSGNTGGEPIALGNREALYRLAGIADLFLLHDRDILIRADDSVVRLVPLPNRTQPQMHFLRRARGFVPHPLQLPPPNMAHEIPTILGVGAELKNTLCLTRKSEAFVSQHIGDLKNPETFAFFQETVSHLASLLEVRPAVLVRDRHPDYLSSAFAEEYGQLTQTPILHLQHHFAHVYAVLAEHGHEGPALGLALDGTGLGDDGSVWGGELLFVHPAAVCPSRPSPGRRLGRITPFPLPGGEAAVREPWRVASGFFGLPAPPQYSVLFPHPDTTAADVFPFLSSVPDRRAIHAAIGQMVRADLAHRREGRKGVMPWTSSCGRLFDAVAAMLGLCDTITYEGQAAIRLEQAQDQDTQADLGGLPSFIREETGGLLEFDAHSFFLHLAAMRQHGASVGQVARCFHLGLADGLAELAALAAARAGTSTIALSGGVMHNITLAQHLPQSLSRRGLVPLVHLHLPPGDGCIAFGQVAWARRVCVQLPSSSVTT